MATTAQRDQEKRIIKVDRQELVNKLTENKKKHVEEYNIAMLSYKDVALEELKLAYEKAKLDLDNGYQSLVSKISSMSHEDIKKENDWQCILHEVSIEMKVPRSYEKEYDVAIDIFKWDTREQIDLTHAEFTCFIRDEWDWKGGFDTVMSMYKK